MGSLDQGENLLVKVDILVVCIHVFGNWDGALYVGDIN